jgi:hypothetical protein
MSETVEQIKETPTGELEQGEFKIKKKPKKLVNKDKVAKIDMAKKEETKEKPEEKQTQKEEDAVQAQEANDSDVIVEEKKNETSSKEVVEEVRPTKEVVKENKNPISEVTTEEEDKVEEVKNVQSKEVLETKNDLPENIEKLISFMKETGGNIEDYVRLNRDYTNIDNESLLNEYYKSTKPHLNNEEIRFIMEDNFSYDEEVDEERDIRRKKLAYKEEIAKAKNFLEDTKEKYYDQIKLRPGVTQDQQKAMDFFNRYNKEQEAVDKQHQEFVQTTKDYFTKDFKGFEFNLGEKKFRYGVSNTDEVVNEQSEITNFLKKFLDENGKIKDHVGYHKALYAARNADTIAQHFYEQGQADSVKDIVNKSKNIDTASRPKNNEDIFIGGLKVKAVSGVDSSKLKIKTRKK